MSSLTTNEVMRRQWTFNALKLALIASFFIFILFGARFASSVICAIFLLFFGVLFYVAFSFLYEAKQRRNRALFTSESKLGALLSGKGASALCAVAVAVVLCINFISEILAIDGREFLLAFVTVPAIFLILRLICIEFLKTQIINVEILSSKISIIASSLICVVTLFCMGFMLARGRVWT